MLVTAPDAVRGLGAETAAAAADRLEGAGAGALMGVAGAGVLVDATCAGAWLRTGWYDNNGECSSITLSEQVDNCRLVTSHTYIRMHGTKHA